MSWYLTTDQITRLQLEISNYCNAQCPMCAREKYHNYDLEWFKENNFNYPLGLNDSLISLDKYKQILSNDSWSSLQEIHFCGNYDEPTTHPDIYDMCKWTLQNFPQIVINIATNGGTRDKKFWKSLGELGKYNRNRIRVIWGIDGLQDTNHLYRKSVKWEKLEENFKSYIQAGGTAVWQFIIFEHNQHQFEYIKNSYKDLGFTELKVIESYRPDKKTNVKAVSIPSIKKSKSNSATTEPKITEVRTSKMLKTVKCKALDHSSILKKSLYINAKGFVTPCCWMGTDNSLFDNQMSFAKDLDISKHNINSYDRISDVLKSEYFTLLKNAIETQTSNICNRHCMTSHNQSINMKQTTY